MNVEPLVQFYNNTQQTAHQEGLNNFNTFLNNAFRTATVNTNGMDAMRAFIQMPDLPNRTLELGATIISTALTDIHDINTRVLPIAVVNKYTFENEIIEYESSLLTLVPEQGVARQVRQRTQKIKSKMERYGLANFMTSDVKATPEGREMLNRLFVQVVLITWKTFAMVALKNLIAITDPRINGTLEQDLTDEVIYNRKIQHEIDSFALGNKRETGMMELISLKCKEMEDNTGYPPNIIIGPRSKIAANKKVNPIYNQHFKGGDLAVDTFNKPLQPEEYFNGLFIIDAPSYNTIDDTFKNLAIRERYVHGRYDLITHEPGSDTTKEPIVWIYDSNHKKHVPKSLSDVFLFGNRFTSMGNGRYQFNITLISQTIWGLPNGEVPPDASVNDDPFLEEYPNNRVYWAHWLFEGGQPGVLPLLNLAKKTIQEWMMFEMDEMDEIDMSRLSAMLVRPMDTGYANYVFIGRGGEQLGFTAHSPEMFEAGNDPTNSTHTLDYRIWIGAHIRDPRLISRTSNIFYDGYLYGLGTIPIKNHEILLRNGFRLSGPRDPSMYVLLYPTKRFNYQKQGWEPTWTDDLDFIHLSGMSPASTSDDRAFDYPGARYYSRLYGWDGVDNMPFDEPSIASYLCRGSYKYMCGDKLMYVAGRTHHGPYEGVTSANIRETGIGVVSSNNE